MLFIYICETLLQIDNLIHIELLSTLKVLICQHFVIQLLQGHTSLLEALKHIIPVVFYLSDWARPIVHTVQG